MDLCRWVRGNAPAKYRPTHKTEEEFGMRTQA